MKALRLILAAAIIFGLGACKNVTQAESSSAREVVRIHERYNKNQIQALWLNAHPNFHLYSSYDNYQTLLRSMQERLGNVQETSRVSWKILQSTNGTFYESHQQTSFARGQALEVFTFQMRKGEALLVGYRIHPNEAPLDEPATPVAPHEEAKVQI